MGQVNAGPTAGLVTPYCQARVAGLRTCIHSRELNSPLASKPPLEP